MSLFLVELRLLLKRRGLIAILLAYALISIAALFSGVSSLESENGDREQLKHYSEKKINKYATKPDHTLKAGYVAYYGFMPTEHTVSVWAPVALGERLDNPTSLSIRLLGLQSQLNASELQQLDLRTFGAFDLSFVWIYLMPLVIGVLCMNLKAEEREAGRWAMLLAQAGTQYRLLGLKIYLRLGFVLLINLLVLLGLVVFVEIPLDQRWWAVNVLLLLYLVFWATVCLLLITLDMSSVKNGLAYFAVWIVLTFLLPGVIYLVQADPTESRQNMNILFEQRQYMNDSWDQNKKADLNAYLQQFPEWSATAPLGEKFDWKWYFAMQHNSDLVVAEEVQAYRNHRIDSAEQLTVFGWLSPVVILQRGLSRIADTDDLAYQNYLDQLAEYHAELRSFYYPYLFFANSFTTEDAGKIPRFDYRRQPFSFPWLVMTNLLFSSFVVIVLLWRRRHNWAV